MLCTSLCLRAPVFSVAWTSSPSFGKPCIPLAIGRPALCDPSRIQPCPYLSSPQSIISFFEGIQFTFSFLVAAELKHARTFIKTPRLASGHTVGPLSGDAGALCPPILFSTSPKRSFLNSLARRTARRKNGHVKRRMLYALT